MYLRVYGQLFCLALLLLLHTTGPAVYIQFVLSATLQCIIFLGQKLKYRAVRQEIFSESRGR